jgi:hypothetical protein
MAIRATRRPASVKARLSKLERELHPEESWVERHDREERERWLVTAEDAPELWLDYTDALAEVGTHRALLADPVGRALISELCESLFNL